MRHLITISLPKDLKKELDALTSKEGVSRSDIVRESLRDYLFVHQFRALRANMLPKAGTKGVYTDQDVFDKVS